MPKKLALFIHGINSSARTWEPLLSYLRADAEITAAYDLETFEYGTGLVTGVSVPRIAEALATFISTRYAEYDDIALVGHSQGGLISRQYIADTLAKGHRLPVTRLLTFATPHIGAFLANFGKRIPGSSEQVGGLAIDSDVMLALAKAWGTTRAEERVRTHYVVGSKDKVVSHTSARGPAWNRDYDVIGSAGHTSVHVPNAADDHSVVIARRFLLDDGQIGMPAADHLQPGLTLNLLNQSDETSRFIFGARRIPLLGRDAEVAKLGELLECPEMPFRWHLVHGSGGAGKSRLALEFCLAVRSEWRAGFLIEEADEPDWTRWQPALPTLIVIDYAARNPERTGRILRALAMRGADSGSSALRRPVRVLLLGRSNSGTWLDNIVGRTSQSKLVEATRMVPDLPLVAFTDAWPLIAYVLQEKGAKLPDQSETLARLAEIDPESRPLYAFFMADAIAAGRDVREFDTRRLVADVIARERDTFWRPAGAGPAEERLLALATMTGGLSREALLNVYTVDGLLPAWDINRHPATFRAMTGRPAAEQIAPLEPDIVGEHFVLDILGQEDQLSARDRLLFCEIAWCTAPLNMASFSARAHQDISGNAQLSYTARLPARANRSTRFWWTYLGGDLMKTLGRQNPSAGSGEGGQGFRLKADSDSGRSRTAFR